MPVKVSSEVSQIFRNKNLTDAELQAWTHRHEKPEVLFHGQSTAVSLVFASETQKILSVCFKHPTIKKISAAMGIL